TIRKADRFRGPVLLRDLHFQKGRLRAALFRSELGKVTRKPKRRNGVLAHVAYNAAKPARNWRQARKAGTEDNGNWGI
ncbi:MAG: hypothetical protein O3C11_02065, partial [Proteobacteria bacterium]|nr:hypothetical protein [Pseudomonadota bacterium]